MAAQSQSNCGVTAEDYAKRRAGFPEGFFARLEALGLFAEKKRVPDIGAGALAGNFKEEEMQIPHAVWAEARRRRAA